MGSSHQGTELKSSCPTCNKEHVGHNLQALLRKLEGCCKPKTVASSSRIDRPSNNLFRPKVPYEVVIARSISSQNKTTYSHWNRYYTDKRAWKTVMRPATIALHGVRFQWSRWFVKRVYSGRGREFDFANLVGGAKPLIDCLTSYGIIEDDSPPHFECGYDQTKVEGVPPHTVLTLLEYRDAGS